MSETEWLIHLFKCPDCGANTRADRAVNCFRCGSEMDHIEQIGEVHHSTGTGMERDRDG